MDFLEKVFSTKLRHVSCLFDGKKRGKRVGYATELPPELPRDLVIGGKLKLLDLMKQHID